MEIEILLIMCYNYHIYVSHNISVGERFVIYFTAIKGGSL